MFIRIKRIGSTLWQTERVYFLVQNLTNCYKHRFWSCRNGKQKPNKVDFININILLYLKCIKIPRLLSSHVVQNRIGDQGLPTDYSPHVHFSADRTELPSSKWHSAYWVPNYYWLSRPRLPLQITRYPNPSRFHTMAENPSPIGDRICTVSCITIK